MSDFNHLKLSASFSGFRIMVLANRLACEDDFSRAVHDKLVEKLNGFIASSHRALAAEREIALNPDADVQDLGEIIWVVERQLAQDSDDLDGIDLIANDISVDWATKEWFDHRTGQWHFIADGEPPRIEIGNARLNGLCAIIDMIRVETGVRFNTYANEPEPAEEASLGRDVKDDGWFYPM